MVSLQQRYRMVLVETQKNDQPRGAAQLWGAGDRPYLAHKFIRLRPDKQLTDALSHVPRLEISLRQFSPVRAGKDAYALHVGQFKLNLPPLPVFRKLPPHGIAATEEQGAAQRVLRLVGQVRIVNDAGEALPVAVILLMKELALEEFGDDLGLGNAAQLLHAAASSTGLCACCLRRKGSATSASITAISTTRTRMTSRRLPWKRQMPSTSAALNISCSHPVLAMRRDIS